ncbi:MAG TPA: hypothetical protein VN643_22370 [Pyrinomonadaceae bacterium]|nr:hypothetical protein [Pyrinomonadaceae bacterium]
MTLRKPVLFALISLNLCFQSIDFRCLAQNGNIVVPAPVSIYPPAPALEAKAVGDVKSFKRTRSDLKASVLSHPIPEATLVFVLRDKRDAKVIVKLPEEAKKPLTECWHAELTFFYLSTFEVHDLETRIRERETFGSVVANVQAKLQKLTIDTPTGRRKISLNEAVSLTHLLNESAQCVVDEAKESLRGKPVAGVKGRQRCHFLASFDAMDETMQSLNLTGT